MYDFEVVDFLGSDFFFFQEISAMPKVNHWTYPQPKSFFFFKVQRNVEVKSISPIGVS